MLIRLISIFLLFNFIFSNAISNIVKHNDLATKSKHHEVKSSIKEAEVNSKIKETHKKENPHTPKSLPPRDESQCCGSEHTLITSGIAITTVPSNVIRVGFTIQNLDPKSAEKAMNANTAIAKKVDNLLKDEQIAESSITTVLYQISPKFSYVFNSGTNENDEIFKGFEVINQIDLKLTNKNVATKLVDELIDLGVTKINYINFEVEKSILEAHKKELLVKAIKDARSQAEILASNSGLSIVDIQAITSSDVSFNNSNPMYLYKSSTSPIVYANSFDITASVTISFIVRST